MQYNLFTAIVIYTNRIIFIHCVGLQMENQHFIAEKNIKIISSNTSLEVRRTKSAIMCAGFCANLQTCCSVSFDKQSSECQLDYSCFPQCVTWQNGTFLRKSSNVILSNQETTVQTGIKTTSNNLTSDKTTTTDMMYYKTTTDKTSYQTNNTTTHIKITDTKASTAAKTSNLTSYETTKLKTTTVKTTPVQTTNDILDCTGVASGSTSGVYTIYIENQPVDVYCEMTGGEQWTVIQKRLDGTTDFYRNWQEYKDGFGDVNLEYWLGNENLHKILSTNSYKLRIDLEDWNGDTRYAEYDTFVVGSENTNYTLTISGYSGDAGDSIINPPFGSTYMMNGMEFTTSDRDNDKNDHINCASESKHSGWWFNLSTDANLNGIYYIYGQALDGVFWNSWHSSWYSLKRVSMKIKPY